MRACRERAAPRSAVPCSRCPTAGAGILRLRSGSFVNLFVYLFRRGLGHVGIGGFHCLDGDQRHFAKGAYQVEVAPGTEEERFAAVADGFGVVLVSALLNVVQDFVALVDDFVVLSSIGAGAARWSSVFEVVPQRRPRCCRRRQRHCLLRVLAAHHGTIKQEYRQ